MASTVTRVICGDERRLSCWNHSAHLHSRQLLSCQSTPKVDRRIASRDDVTLAGQIRRHLIACLLLLSGLARREGLWAGRSAQGKTAVAVGALSAISAISLLAVFLRSAFNSRCTIERDNDPCRSPAFSTHAR